MHELQSIVPRVIARIGGPKIVECAKPLIGYHGTCFERANAILAEGFCVSHGRAGLGAYFYVGEKEKALFAAEMLANWKFRFEKAVVIEAELHVRRILDLDSEQNYAFVRMMIEELAKYARKHCPVQLENYAHPHFAGLLLQDAMGSVQKLDSFDATGSFFIYDDMRLAEKGLVVFDPSRIFNARVVSGLANC